MSIPFNPITISVGKKSLSSFISLQIEQNIGKHHRFQMSVELETGSNRYVHNINSSKDWLGESIVVKAANKPIFVGVVTNVQLHREGSDFWMYHRFWLLRYLQNGNGTQLLLME